ncbi:MAG: DUF3160 domain-containing protein [Planctomycetes bacterium]|nr:DUF3160 domain-containing protein [Planctomycetota bacterium]
MHQIARLSAQGVMALFVLAAPLVAQTGGGPADWRAVARSHGIDGGDLDCLAAQKFLITNERFVQVFDPYVKSDLPVFVTADALLNAFHVNLEHAVLSLEVAQAKRLEPMVVRLLEAVRSLEVQILDDPELKEAVRTARWRAELVLGTALRLVGNDTLELDPAVDELVRAEFRRVLEARDVAARDWLGGEHYFDYSTFKPRGFYDLSERLQRYFRAVRWLQAVWFRVDKDDELLAVLMMAAALCPRAAGGALTAAQRSDRELIRFRRDLVGGPDRPDLLDAAEWIRWSVRLRRTSLLMVMSRAQLAAIRKTIERHLAANPPQINDRFAPPPEERSRHAYPDLRVLSTAQVPDDVLFQRTTSLKRPLPSSLEVCAALGSRVARELLPETDREELLSTIDRCRGSFQGVSHYQEYLSCLAALLAPADVRAPALFASRAWAIKSCQTVLAGWAQLRYCWVLQARGGYSFFGGHERPPGFVEPYPDFYRKLARLSARTRAAIRAAGPVCVTPADHIERIRSVVRCLQICAWVERGGEALSELSRSERTAADDMLRLAWDYGFEDVRDQDERKLRANLMAWLQKLADQLKRGSLQHLSPRAQKRLSWLLQEHVVDSTESWAKLEGLCDRLGALADKQLEARPFNEADRKFLVDFGPVLGNVMGYGGNSYLCPTDDAPRIVDVFTDGTSASPMRILHAGVGRPRALYVLYPVKGEEILCRGAVLPCYEFTYPERLDVDAWMRILGSPSHPGQPAWVRPIVEKAGIGPPRVPEPR